MIVATVLVAACGPSEKEKKFDDYCRMVKAAVDLDTVELTEPQFQQKASDRFGESVTGHSYQEITMCATRAVDFSKRDECWLNHDYQCLANIAKAAEDALP